MKRKSTPTVGITLLRPALRYVKTISYLSLAIALIAMTMVGCKKDDFKDEVFGVCPVITATDPIDNAVDVALNKVISITFNTDMDAATINATTLLIKQGANLVAGKVAATANPKTYTFTPDAALLPFVAYSGTVTMGAKDIYHSAMLADYTWGFTTIAAISLSSSPVLGGTTAGGGSFAQGTTINVTATPNVGFTFTNWTENGNIVSTSSSYQFKIAGNRVLVANFTGVPVGSAAVILSSNPVAGGINIGSGAYVIGSSVTISSVANAGFTFTNWTENGNVVSTSTNYTFVITANRNFVANYTVGSATPSILGTAALFGAFGGNAGITNSGLNTVINNGSIGTTAASTLITGFHDGTTNDIYTETPLNKGLVSGRIYTAPPAPGNATSFAIAQQGLADATIAYNSISPAAKPGGTDPGAGELGGLTLAPGIYKSASGTFKITNGTLTLDAQGNPNAQWFFQTAAGLTVGIAGPAGARSVVLINGGLAKNVYWYVGSAAVINAAGGGIMTGTIISSAGVTFSTAGNAVQTVLNGRAISLVASVTMVNTTINVPQ